MATNGVVRERAAREKDLVAFVSLLAAVLLTGMKLVAGLLTGSLGLLSEAAHSALDLVAALVTLLAVRASARPADREHTYGHGKIENLSALFETLLLLVTCVWIIHEAVQRLCFKPIHVDPTIWAMLVVVFSIIIDISRSRALSRAARRHRSQALEADALHFSTDVWSSAVVLLGLILVRVSHVTGIAWLAHADAVGALGVAGIVVWVSVRLGRRAAVELVDGIPPALHDEILRVVHVEGVRDVRQVRLRRSGADLFADIALTVDRGSSFERAHHVAAEAEAAVRRIHPEADVVVKIDPVPGDNEGLLDAIRLVADRGDLRVHGVRVHRLVDRPSVELDLEVDEALSLDEAHAVAGRFERALRLEIPPLDRLLIRLEPVGESSATVDSWPEETETVRRALEAVRRELRIAMRPREIVVRRTASKLSASFRCAIRPEATLASARTLGEEIERRLRERVPQLEHVMIQVEPLARRREAVRNEPRAALEMRYPAPACVFEETPSMMGAGG